MSYNDLPHDDFKTGFEVGFKALRGETEPMPLRPSPPRLKRQGMSMFLEGVFAGIEAAGINLEDFR